MIVLGPLVPPQLDLQLRIAGKGTPESARWPSTTGLPQVFPGANITSATEIVKVEGQWLFSRRIIRLWDGEVLARFPGRGTFVPRKRPPELMVKRDPALEQGRLGDK